MFAIGVVGMLLAAATDSGLALLVREFLNGAFIKRNEGMLWMVPGGVFVLFLLRGIGDYVANYFPGWVGRQVIKTLRARAVRALPESADSAISMAQASGQMLSRLTYNIELVAEAATNAITVMIKDTLTIVGLLGVLFYINWQLAVFSLVAAPLIAWLVQRINRRFRRYSARIQSSMGDVTRVAKEAIDGHRLIKLFNAQPFEAQQFERVNEQNRHNNMRLIMTKAVSNPVVQQIAAIGLAAVMYIAIRQMLAQQLTGRRFHRLSHRVAADHGSRSGAWSRSAGRCSRASRRAPASSKCWTCRPRMPAAREPSSGRAATSNFARCRLPTPPKRARCCTR